MEDWEDLGLVLTVSIVILGCCVITAWKAYTTEPRIDALLRDTV